MVTLHRYSLYRYLFAMFILSITINGSSLFIRTQFHTINIYRKFGSQHCVRHNHNCSRHQCITIRPTYKMITFIGYCHYGQFCSVIILTCTYHLTMLCLQFYYMSINCNDCSQIQIRCNLYYSRSRSFSIRPTHKMITLI